MQSRGAGRALHAAVMHCPICSKLSAAMVRMCQQHHTWCRLHRRRWLSTSCRRVVQPAPAVPHQAMPMAGVRALGKRRQMRRECLKKTTRQHSVRRRRVLGRAQRSQVAVACHIKKKTHGVQCTTAIAIAGRSSGKRLRTMSMAKHQSRRPVHMCISAAQTVRGAWLH